MNSCSQRPQTINQGGGRSIQKLVSNAIDAASFRGPHLQPAAVADDFFQGNSRARAAPCGDQHIRVFSEYGFGSCLFARNANELASGCLDEFSYPRLRGDERLAPFL